MRGFNTRLKAIEAQLAEQSRDSRSISTFSWSGTVENGDVIPVVGLDIPADSTLRWCARTKVAATMWYPDIVDLQALDVGVNLEFDTVGGQEIWQEAQNVFTDGAKAEGPVSLFAQVSDGSGDPIENASAQILFVLAWEYITLTLPDSA